jgi:hypothetical protein
VTGSTIKFTALISKWDAAVSVLAAQSYALQIVAKKENKSSSKKRKVSLFIVVVLFVLLLGEVLEKLIISIGSPISLVVGFFSGVFVIGIASVDMYRRTAHIYTPGVANPISYELDRSGVTTRYAGAHMFIPWKSIDGWQLRKSAVLMLAVGTTFIMPYSAMADGSDKDEALEQIEAWRKAAQ